MNLRRLLISVFLIASLLVNATLFASGQEDQGKTVPPLKVALPTFAGETLDPSKGGADILEYLDCMYDQLFGRSKIGELTPGIVKKWEMAPDGLSWTFYLRNDVMFHDGSKCTAKDVAFSLEYYKREDAFQSKLWRSLLGYPGRTEIVDDYTLRVYCPTPQPYLLYYLSTPGSERVHVLPKDYIEKNGVEYFRSHPIGTGSYKFVSLVAGDHMEFEAVQNHWTGIVPGFKRVIIYLIPEETTVVAMLQRGELDYAPVGLENSLKLKKEGFTVLSRADGGLYVNFPGAYLPQAKDSPVADLRVRQALRLAIDRQAIASTLLGGMGAPHLSPRAISLSNDDWTPELAKKWQAWYEQNYRYDPAEAKRLLAEAGYGPGGKKLTFDMWTAPDPSAPYLVDVALACAGYWAEVGADVVHIQVDGAKFSVARRPTVSPDMIGKVGISARKIGTLPSIRSLGDFTSAQAAWALLVGAPFQTEMDGLFSEGMSTTRPERYQQILDRTVDLAESSCIYFGVVKAPITSVAGPRVEAAPPVFAIQAENFSKWKYTGKEP